MITAQDIREKTFEKATFGGYDMSQVDDFLEEMAADIAASQKESSVLRGKMKVLVDKIEEYRSTEDAMRRALVSAQQIAKDIEGESQAKADAILAEAQAKADAILAEAQAKADAITGDLKTQRVQEEDRLAAAKEASANYIEKMLLVCQKQNDFLTALKTMEMPPKAAPAAPAEEAAPEYGGSAYPVEEAGEEAPAEEAVPAESAGTVESGEEVDEPTRMFRF